MIDFIGILLPNPVSHSLQRLCYGLPNTTWVDPRSMCVHLRSLGKLEGTLLMDIAECLGELSAPPFLLRFQEVHVNFSGKRGAIEISLCSDPVLQQVLSQIEKCLHRIKIEKKSRDFTPHLLLGYFEHASTSKLKDYLEMYAGVNLPSVEVTKISLLSSHSSPKGVVLEERQSFPLFPL
jgi:2'-5' RNA ligase